MKGPGSLGPVSSSLDHPGLLGSINLWHGLIPGLLLLPTGGLWRQQFPAAPCQLQAGEPPPWPPFSSPQAEPLLGAQPCQSILLAFAHCSLHSLGYLKLFADLGGPGLGGCGMQGLGYGYGERDEWRARRLKAFWTLADLQEPLSKLFSLHRQEQTSPWQPLGTILARNLASGSLESSLWAEETPVLPVGA